MRYKSNFILLLLLGLGLSCRKQVPEVNHLGILPSTIEAQGSILNAFMNPDGTILVQTIKDLNDSGGVINYLSNQFYLFDKDFHLIRSKTLDGYRLAKPIKIENKWFFPSFKQVSSNSGLIGILELGGDLRSSERFYDCNSLLEDPGELQVISGAPTLFYTSNSDWVIGYTASLNGVGDSLRPIISNVGSNLNDLKRKYRYVGKGDNKLVALMSLNEKFKLLTAASYNGVSSLMNLIELNDLGFVIQSKQNYASYSVFIGFGGVIENSQNKLLLYDGETGVFEFDENMNNKALYPIGEKGDSWLRQYDEFIELTDGGFGGLTDSLGSDFNYTTLFKFTSNFNKQVAGNYRSRSSAYITGAWTSRDKFTFRKLLKKPDGGYILLLSLESLVSNKYNWIFVNLDEQLKPLE